MKAYWGSGVIAPCILTLALDGNEWSASCSDCFTPRERVYGTHWLGSLVGSRASLDMVVKEEIPVSTRNQTLVIKPIAQSLYFSHIKGYTIILSEYHCDQIPDVF